MWSKYVLRAFRDIPIKAKLVKYMFVLLEVLD